MKNSEKTLLIKEVRNKLLRPPFMVEIAYTGNPIFYATPNLSGLQLRWRGIDFKQDASFPSLTKVHPTSYDANGNSFWFNKPFGCVNFAQKEEDVTVFGLSLVGGDRIGANAGRRDMGTTNFRSRKMVIRLDNKPFSTTRTGGGAFHTQRLLEVEEPVYIDASLKYGNKDPMDLLGFAFGVIPNKLMSDNWLVFPDSWESPINKCICSNSTVIKSGCKCGGV